MRIIKTLVFFTLTLCLTQALPFAIQDDNSQNKDKILRMRIISDLAELPFANQDNNSQKKEFLTQDNLNKLFCAFRVAAEIAEYVMKIDYQYHQDHPDDPYHQNEQGNTNQDKIDQESEELQESNVMNNVQGINVPRPLAEFHPIRIRNGDLKKDWDDFDWNWWFVNSKTRRAFTPFDFKIIG